MRLCDLPIAEIKIGQVVKAPLLYAVVVQITGEFGGHFIDREVSKEFGLYPRFHEITLLMETGRTTQPIFLSLCKHLIVNRVLVDYNINQNPLGSEFFRFDKIVKAERSQWDDYLLKEKEINNG